MSEHAHITWSKNAQGRLIPLAVTYTRTFYEEVTVTRRDIQASAEQAEVKRVSLPRISLSMPEPAPPIIQPRPPVAPRPRQKSALARVDRIRQIHRKMKRDGRIADRALVEEVWL